MNLSARLNVGISAGPNEADDLPRSCSDARVGGDTSALGLSQRRGLAGADSLSGCQPSVHIVSRPKTRFKRPNAIQEPILMVSSAISACENLDDMRDQNSSSSP